MYLSRVTWLVLGTTMVLVAVVVLAAVFFINGSSQRFPRGAGPGASGVAQVQPVPGPGANPRRGAHRVQLSAATGRHRVTAHLAATGLARSLGAPPSGRPRPSRHHKPTLPTEQQYGSSLQQLKAALAGH